MLADVARIDLLLADGVWTAEGPAAAAPVAEASVALAGALRLSALQAVVQRSCCGRSGRRWATCAAAHRLLDAALAQPDRPPDVPRTRRWCGRSRR